MDWHPVSSSKWGQNSAASACSCRVQISVPDIRILGYLWVGRCSIFPSAGGKGGRGNFRHFYNWLFIFVPGTFKYDVAKDKHEDNCRFFSNIYTVSTKQYGPDPITDPTL
jgi:hypothetical protein